MQLHQEFYDIKPGQHIASIGVGGGLWEVALSFFCKDVTFYLNDTNSQLLNRQSINEAIDYFSKKYQRSNSCSFNICIGTDSWLNIAVQNLDKVLINNSLHEIEDAQGILEKCALLLKTDGSLYIEEQIASFEGALHQGCGKRLFTEPQLLQLAIDANLTFKARKDDVFEFVKQ